MENDFWKLSFFILLLVWLSIRAVFKKNALKTKIKIKRRVIIERVLVSLNLVSIVFLPLYIVFSTTLDCASMHLPPAVRFIALCVYALNLGLFAWCHISLGGNWSGVLEIKKGHKLIQKGPYKNIRHPMYTHFWLLIISQGLLLDNSIVLIYGLFAWGILYFIRVSEEEKMMITEFGKEYKEYMKRTGRLLPKFYS